MMIDLIQLEKVHLISFHFIVDSLCYDQTYEWIIHVIQLHSDIESRIINRYEFRIVILNILNKIKS
jgi:hypothetical protein